MQQRVDKMSRKTVSGIVLLILLASFLSIRIKTTQASDATSCIIADTNDWIGGTGLDFMDITSACIVNVDYFTVRFEMSVADNIPEDPSPMFIGYVWALDLDQDGIFNEFPPYAPNTPISTLESPLTQTRLMALFLDGMASSTASMVLK